jgi:hypothetical protein
LAHVPVGSKYQNAHRVYSINLIRVLSLVGTFTSHATLKGAAIGRKVSVLSAKKVQKEAVLVRMIGMK